VPTAENLADLLTKMLLAKEVHDKLLHAACNSHVYVASHTVTARRTCEVVCADERVINTFCCPPPNAGGGRFYASSDIVR
jgi:hypothetical protein